MSNYYYYQIALYKDTNLVSGFTISHTPLLQGMRYLSDEKCCKKSWLFFERYISKQKQTCFYQLRQSTVPEFDHVIKKQINENRFISTYLHYCSSILNAHLRLAAHATELSCQTFARAHSFEQITLVLASWHQLWLHFREKVEILFTGVSNQWDVAATEIEKDRYSEGDDGSQANVAVINIKR